MSFLVGSSIGEEFGVRDRGLRSLVIGHSDLAFASPSLSAGNESPKMSA